VNLSTADRRTSELYGEIHAIVEEEHVAAVRDNVLTASDLGLTSTYLVGKRALDAGVGGMGRALRGLFRLGCRDITAVDISGENIRNAWRRNCDISEYVSFQTMNIQELDYPDESFHFIHCSGVLHHTQSPPEALKQLYHCLSPGGWIYLGLYGKGGLLYGTARFARLLAKAVPYRTAAYCAKRLFSGSVASYLLDYLFVPYQFHYTETEARQLISETGLVNVRRLMNPLPLSSSFWNRFLKPSTYDPTTMLGKMMVGSGWIVLMAQKPPHGKRT